MFKNEKEKFYLIFLAVFLACAILVWQGIIGERLVISDNVARIQDKNLTIAAYGTKEETLARNLENYNFVKNRLEGINGYFVNGDENASIEKQNLPEFVKEIEDVASQTSNSLTIDFVDKTDLSSDAGGGTSDVKKTAAAKTSDSYAIRLNLAGSFSDLGNFIARFESMPYYAYIDSVTINAESSPSGSGNSVTKSFSGQVRSMLAVKVFKKQNLNLK